MHFTVVIDMKNPNALIAMAQVAQNANNPYAAFCEYIKYCVFSTASSVVTLSEIRTGCWQRVWTLYASQCLSEMPDLYPNRRRNYV